MFVRSHEGEGEFREKSAVLFRGVQEEQLSMDSREHRLYLDVPEMDVVDELTNMVLK